MSCACRGDVDLKGTLQDGSINWTGARSEGSALELGAEA